MTEAHWLTARPIAHRAFHDRAGGRIENTLSAVTAAIEHDFAIEVDLQLTDDEEAIVFHDDTLERLSEAKDRVDRLEQLPAIPPAVNRNPKVVTYNSAMNSAMPARIRIRPTQSNGRI